MKFGLEGGGFKSSGRQSNYSLGNPLLAAILILKNVHVALMKKVKRRRDFKALVRNTRLTNHWELLSGSSVDTSFISGLRLSLGVKAKPSTKEFGPYASVQCALSQGQKIVCRSVE